MSLFGYKDLDYLLAETLDSKSLGKFTISNKYYHGLFDDEFYTRLYIKKYSHITSLVKKNITKKIFYENEKILEDIQKQKGDIIQDFQTYIKLCPEAHQFAIIEDRDDLLCLIEHFSIKAVAKYSLIELAIEKDSILCFNYFMHNTGVEEYFVNLAIKHKSDKILERINSMKFSTIFTTKGFFLSFSSYSPKYIELYLKYFGYFSNESLLEIIYLIDYPSEDINKWREKFNIAFSLFIKSLYKEQLDLIRAHSLNRNRFDTIKLITKYTSILNPFVEE